MNTWLKKLNHEWKELENDKTMNEETIKNIIVIPFLKNICNPMYKIVSFPT